MKTINRMLVMFVFLAMVVLPAGVLVKPAEAAGPYVCIPSCSSIDGRMLSLASIGYETLAGAKISIEVSVPQTMTTFEVGFFDGDTGGLWDIGSMQLIYRIYADPTKTSDTSIELAQWIGSSMVDNAWADITLTNDPQAQAPSGDYFYHILVELPEAGTVKTYSNFKVRSNTPVEMALNQSFAYAVPVFTLAESQIIYPEGLPTSSNPNPYSTYDGTWDLYLSIPTSGPSFVLWDGDMDFGSFDCSVNDTNDLDTPDGSIPTWATGISDRPEGVAISSLNCKNSSGQVITGPDGQIYTTGDPTDDSRSGLARRSPSVFYEVIDPNGVIYQNSNPSGNREWEQFIISSDPTIPADYSVDELLPAGVYHIHVTGLDTVNLNAWHPVYQYVCVNEDGTPCVPVLDPYLIGDTVWYDADGDGVQDEGELGIPGVSVTLLDGNGVPMPGGTAVTDGDGKYSFKVDAGTYSVRVDASNFEAGGALAGLSSTTGGEVQTYTVVDQNVLTYDFGYRGLGTIGNFVWQDLNANGIQDAVELGLGGVTVNLLGSDGSTILVSQVTGLDGFYQFTGLLPGTYYVQFVLPSGYAFTFQGAAGSTVDNDSNAAPATGLTAAIALAAGQADLTIDAGMLPAPNYCGFIRTPGFWKNYANHMTDATFLNIIQHTQDFNYLTVKQAVKILSTNNGKTKLGIPALDGTDARFLKFLLTAEINAVWNGQDTAAGLGGLMGIGIYEDTTVNAFLHQAYLDRYKFSTGQYNGVVYLGGDGEGKSASMCLIQPVP